MSTPPGVAAPASHPGGRRVPMASSLLALLAILGGAQAATAGAGEAVSAGSGGAGAAPPPCALSVADPVHGDLEELAARGALALPGLSTRPLSRFRVARALAQALDHRPDLAGDATFQRALRAFAPELLEPGTGRRASSPPRSLVDLRDEESWLRSEVFLGVRAEASGGRRPELTDSTRVGIRISWIVWPALHVYEELFVADIERGRHFGDPLRPGTDINISQERVYAAIGTHYAEIVLGRDRLSWGPGATGTLLLSGGARPFTHLRLGRAFFGGGVTATIVNGALSRAEGRYVAFHRVEWRPGPRLRLGASEGVRYDAAGFEPLYAIGVIPYQVVSRLLLRDNASRGTDGLVRDNVLVSVDGSLQAHRLLQIYGEVLIDDIRVQSDDHATRLGHQLGAFATGTLLGSPFRARLEWTRVWNFVYSTFYGADFEHAGRPLGHPLGPDSRVIHTHGEWLRGRDWTLSATVERFDRGEGRLGEPWQPGDPRFVNSRPSVMEGVVETRWRAFGGIRYLPSPRLQIRVEVGPAWTRNGGNVVGNDFRGLAGRVELGAHY